MDPRNNKKQFKTSMYAHPSQTMKIERPNFHLGALKST